MLDLYEGEFLRRNSLNSWANQGESTSRVRYIIRIRIKRLSMVRFSNYGQMKKFLTFDKMFLTGASLKGIQGRNVPSKKTISKDPA